MAGAHVNTFRLVVASVGETLFDGAAASATMPGAAGEFTLLPKHEAFVTTLKKGTVRIKDASGAQKEFPIEDGVLECSQGRAVVLL
jgi:F-type H+-transporting ATPase subunit epsilon